MIDSKLAGQINEIRALRIDDRLTDEAVVVLMNIHLSVANLIVANNLETEYGSAAPYREAMNRLFAICHKRCRSNQTLARRSRMIPALYNLFAMPDAAFDEYRDRMVEHCAWRAIDEWQKKHDTTKQPLTEPERRTEYGILRCIIETMRYVVEEEKTSQPDFRYMQQRIETWAAEMNADGSWDGITTGEALQRLDILTGYANAHGGIYFDSVIERARNRCFEQVISHGTATTSRELFLLYWTLIWGIGQPDWTRAEAVAKRAAERLNACPEGSDEYLWSLAVRMDYTCIKLNHDIKMQMLAQIA